MSGRSTIRRRSRPAAAWASTASSRTIPRGRAPPSRTRPDATGRRLRARIVDERRLTMVRTDWLTITVVASFVAIGACGSVSGPAGPDQSGGSGAGAGGNGGTGAATGRGGSAGFAGDTAGIAGTTGLGGASGTAGATAGVAGASGTGGGATGGAGRGGNGNGGNGNGARGGNGNGGNGNGAHGGNGNGGNGNGGKSGTAGGGTTGTAGGGGTTGSAGAGGTDARSCAPSCTLCMTGACCGTGCCASGEWCDQSGATPVCRCGNGAACTNGLMCAASLGGPGICGTICCGGAGNPCPVSRRIYKRDITPVDDPSLQRLYAELRRIQLTTYQYKQDPPSAPRRLGFIIDDTKTPYPINPDGTTVDLYGYMSMAVAAIQVQSREIEDLRREVARLKSSARRRQTPAR